MKNYWNVLLIMCAGLIMISCDKNRSYTDMLNAEKKAVRRFMDENDIKVLKNFPKDSIFAENEFVKLDSDVYLQIVDKGNGNKPTARATKVMCRFIADRISITDPDDQIYYYYKNVSNYGPHSNGTYPLVFRYGYLSLDEYRGVAPDMQYFVEELMSEGLASGLDYVSENGKVRLIVPFKRGSAVDQESGWPVYFEIVEYKFE